MDSIPESDTPPTHNYISQEHFDTLYQFGPEQTKISFNKRLRNFCQPVSSCSNFFHFLLSFFPILSWLPSYEWGNWLFGDLIAGVTIGIVQVPQAVAYALLCGVDPVYGLYSSFFSVWLYMFFGTSKYVSIGSFAIISLMTGESATNIEGRLAAMRVSDQVQLIQDFNGPDINIKNLTESYHGQFDNLTRITIVTTVCFFVGLVQIAMAFLRVGFLASYLSDQVVSGFSVAAAVHVVVVQVNKLIQVKLTKFTGIGFIIKQFFDVCFRIGNANWGAAAVSLASFIFLFIGKDIINVRFKKCLPVPLPFELLLVILATVCSSMFDLNGTYGILIVNHVPTGLPMPVIPRFDLFPYIFSEVLEISFVIVAIHLSMCKIFNRKLGTSTDNNQELYAIGFLASIGSFFNTYPVSSALGRSMLNVECGARTQLAALFCGALILVVILFVGPLLSALPMCILAVIIIYSMKSVFLKVSELGILWKISKIDWAIWVVSFLATTLFNVMQGLLISVGFALLTTVFRIQWPRWYNLAMLTGTEDYRDIGRYGRMTEFRNVVVFRFDAPLLYTNVEHFQNSVNQVISKCEGKKQDGSDKSSKSLLKKISLVSKKQVSTECVKHLVLDCSGFTFVDFTSVSALSDLFHQLGKKNVTMYFAGAKAPIRDIFESSNFYLRVPKKFFYPTIHDAVMASQQTETIYSDCFTPRIYTEQRKTRMGSFLRKDFDVGDVNAEVPDLTSPDESYVSIQIVSS
uniref:STAS domain-containing protein n=1 Tax=Rhabditophanes sp. KR3021 TaxID=114890 RepID=A0AC35U1Z5_9BILA